MAKTFRQCLGAAYAHRAFTAALHAAGSRNMLALACCSLLALNGCGGTGAKGDGTWRDQMKELRIALVSEPRGTGNQVVSLEAFQKYLEAATGLPVRIHRANDYNSVIQALSSGQVDVTTLGAGAYANIHEQIGGLAAPILIAVRADGDMGYYASLIVRADSPYRSLADLKNRSLGIVDFNSVSGYLMPMHAMRRAGIDPERFFSRVGVTGGHAQSVIAVNGRQYDAAFILAMGGNPRDGFSTTAYSMMVDKGLIPRDAMRSIWTVGPVPNEPIVMRTDRPQAAQDIVRGALAAMPYDLPGALSAYGELPGATLTPSNDAAFAEVFALRKEAIAAQRRGTKS
jgi:phosphonate transport system substrate-binding protein